MAKKPALSTEDFDEVESKTKKRSSDPLKDLDIEGLSIGRSNFKPVRYLKSGFAAFDRDIMGGGLPSGKLTQFWGPPGAGKSALIRHYAACAQRQEPDKYVCIYNSEFDLDPSQLEEAGIDMDRLLFIQKSNITQVGEDILKLANSGKLSFLALDSVAALVPDNANQPGAYARAVKKFVNPLCEVIFRNDLWCCFSNQITMAIGCVGPNTRVRWRKRL